MNTAPLNTFDVNADLLDFNQRSAVVASVVAQVYAEPRVHRMTGGVAFQPLAQVSVDARLRVRGAANVEVSASILDAIKSYTTSPVTISPGADVVASGTSYERGFVRDPSVWSVQANVGANPRLLARSPLVLAVDASIAAEPHSYSLVYAPVVVPASVDVWVSVGVYQRIPFVDNAVDERSIIVPYEGRTAVVV